MKDSNLTELAHLKGKTIVVKYGGAAMVHKELRAAVVADLVSLSKLGCRVVLVHGGGPEIDALLKKLHIEAKFIEGLRYTDGETIDVVQMVLAGKVNKDLCALIARAGGRALGLCGADASLMLAHKISSKKDLGFVGELENVNANFLHEQLTQGYIPVIASVALANDAENLFYNINADTAAAQIALAVQAAALVLLTDIAGILRDVNNPASLISELAARDIPELISAGIVSKGMIPKVNSCAEIIAGGVGAAYIVDGRREHALIDALRPNNKLGTKICN